LKRGNQRIAFKNIFGVYQRDNSQRMVCFNKDHEIVNKYQYGDDYILEGRVGGGGIYKLILKEIKIVMIAKEGEEYDHV